jgi:hypothetical protein
MAYFSGQHGVLKFKQAGTGGGQYVEVAKVRDWGVNFQMETLDTTTLQDTDRTRIPGLRSFSGTATVLYYSEDTGTSNFARLASTTIDTGGSNPTIRNFGENDTAVAAQFELQVTQGNVTKTVAFTAYVTGYQMTCATGEVFSASITFEGTGAPHTFNF